MRLLTPEHGNAKLAKSAGSRYYTVGLSLAPHTLSGHSVCAGSTPACRELCLNTAGNGRMFQAIHVARARKTRFLFQHRAEFLVQLRKELRQAERKAQKNGKILACRLNVLSDLVWERLDPALFQEFSGVQFYDYTKLPGRILKELPRNYHLTLSRSELTDNNVLQAWIRKGRNVAVVFSTSRSQSLPTHYLGVQVIDGDTNDLRFLDPAGVIVGLRAKGRARMRSFLQHNARFVVDAASIPC